MDLETLEHEVNQLTDRYLASLRQTDAEALGMDPRAGYRLYVSEEEIVVRRDNQGALEYYGGFEYVDADDKLTIGDLIVYRSGSDRVADALHLYFNPRSED